MLLVVLVSAVIDARTRRIPNLLTLPAILAGLTLWLLTGPMRAFLAALVSVVLVLALGFCLFAVGILGGGDGKLLAAVAGLMGPHFLGEALLWTALLGGVVAIGLLAWKRALIPFLRRLFQAGYQLVVWHIPAEGVIEGEGHRIPYAIIVAGGVVLALVAQQKGFALVPRIAS